MQIYKWSHLPSKLHKEKKITFISKFFPDRHFSTHEDCRHIQSFKCIHHFIFPQAIYIVLFSTNQDIFSSQYDHLKFCAHVKIPPICIPFVNRHNSYSCQHWQRLTKFYQAGVCRPPWFIVTNRTSLKLSLARIYLMVCWPLPEHKRWLPIMGN